MPIIPGYNPPDFTAPHLVDSPVVSVEVVPADGVVPRNFHGTSNHPEYVHWVTDTGCSLRKAAWML